MTAASNAEICRRAKVALRRALGGPAPELTFDADGRLAKLDDNLVKGVTPSIFEADFQADGGDEMHGEMRAPHASSALAVNAFSRWRADPHLLHFAGHRGFTAIRFEQQYQTGLGGVPAYFDTFAEAGEVAFGVEVKCLEYLTRPSPKYLQGFAETIEAAYAKHGPAGRGWLGMVTRLKSTPEHHKVLFTAQLVKQALALADRNPRSPACLVYLFWEPSNWREFDVFRQHHAELNELADQVGDDRVSFDFQSFTTLFRQWTTEREPSWIGEHAAALLGRYDVPIQD